MQSLQCKRKEKMSGTAPLSGSALKSRVESRPILLPSFIETRLVVFVDFGLWEHHTVNVKRVFITLSWEHWQEEAEPILSIYHKHYLINSRHGLGQRQGKFIWIAQFGHTVTQNTVNFIALIEIKDCIYNTFKKTSSNKALKQVKK